MVFVFFLASAIIIIIFFNFNFNYIKILHLHDDLAMMTISILFESKSEKELLKLNSCEVYTFILSDLFRSGQEINVL